ncbi:MAG TPA: hypothetical protein VI279_03755 [Rhodocyclaceae bacterium]
MEDEDYECLGICQADPSSGNCIGCGRPLQAPQAPQPLAPSNSAPAEPDNSCA